MAVAPRSSQTFTRHGVAAHANFSTSKIPDRDGRRHQSSRPVAFPIKVQCVATVREEVVMQAELDVFTFAQKCPLYEHGPNKMVTRAASQATSMAVLEFLTTLVVLAAAQLAATQGPQPGQIKNLVTFGDSYTDVYQTGDGGTAWPVYAAMYGNFSLYPYAKAGATCSNKLVDRPYGSVTEYQLPLYLTEKDNGSLELDPDVTVYTLWIGTNDNGAGGILTGDQTPGVTLVDTITCAVNWVKTLYTSGARNFVFQNVRLLSRCRSRKCANERLGLSDAASAADGHVFCRLVPEWWRTPMWHRGSFSAEMLHRVAICYVYYLTMPMCGVDDEQDTMDTHRQSEVVWYTILCSTHESGPVVRASHGRNPVLGFVDVVHIAPHFDASRVYGNALADILNTLTMTVIAIRYSPPPQSTISSLALFLASTAQAART
ncbi:predicted protein [Postia placenta Mad-698-R]|nr:predicted protein [Postia placenta Mad-698-R]